MRVHGVHAMEFDDDVVRVRAVGVLSGVEKVATQFPAEVLGNDLPDCE